MPIYFLRHIPTGRVKVGRAVDVHARIASLATGWAVPEEYELVGTLAGTGVAGDAAEEAALHMDLAKGYVHGEWFAPCRALTAVLAQFASLQPVPATEIVHLQQKGRTRARFWREVEDWELRRAVQGRFLQIARRYRQGETMESIAESERCSRQRIHQILTVCKTRAQGGRWRPTGSWDLSHNRRPYQAQAAQPRKRQGS